MIVVRPDAGTLARIRLAPSPAIDVVAWIRLAAAGRRHPAFGDPGAAARFALRDPDVALIARAIGNGRYIPHLLTPTPTTATWARGWAEQLEQICQAPAQLAADSMSPAGNGPAVIPAEVRRAVDAGSFARRAAQGLRRFYQVALADQDEYLGSAAAADLAHRGQVFATRGLEHVLGTLHPDLRWTGTELRLTLPYEESIELTGAELLLMPTILYRGGIGAQLDGPRTMCLAYPARGLTTAHHKRRQGLPDLIGPTRAAILRDLDVPRTTTHLSHRHTLAKSTISHHLGVLLHAGLVARSRDGGTVFYSRTRQGDRMATTTQGPPRPHPAPAATAETGPSTTQSDHPTPRPRSNSPDQPSHHAAQPPPHPGPRSNSPDQPVHHATRSPHTRPRSNSPGQPSHHATR